MLASPWFDAFWVGLVGLLVGSFLNVVIYRLPQMMERQWALEHAQYRGEPIPSGEALNLMTPRSRCPHCKHTLSWYENIPVLSYLALRGQCRACGVRIPLRYPVVELATGVLFFFCAWRWGLSMPTVVWCGVSAALLALGIIDWDTTFLPDSITFPLLWAGLIAAHLGWSGTPLGLALWGAVGGYVSLWLVYWTFKLVTGKEGMGYGDFKLFAALGAWFGATSLIPIILIASVIGSVVGLIMKFNQSLREGGYVPFGPFLVGAGFVALALTPGGLLHLFRL